MRFNVGRLMLVVAVEAGLLRLALAMTTYRYVPMSLEEVLGAWLTLNLMSVLPSVIWYLRSKSREPKDRVNCAE
jgi:hypothetical protein